MSMSTRGWPQQTRIIIIKWTGWPILWIPMSFFHQPPSLANKVIEKVATMAGLEVMFKFSDTGFHSPRLTWVQLLLSAQSASSKCQHWFPNMSPFPGAFSQLTWWQTECFLFVLPEWLVILDTDLLSLHSKLLPNYYLWTYKMPYSLSQYSTQHCF